MDLSRFPRRRYTEHPTPIEKLPHFTKALAATCPGGVGPEIWIKRDDMLGKVWILNVWASWCVACREEHPVLVEFSKKKLVPLYGLNNMFGQIPIVGLFLGGGSNEGIFGITYEVTGSTANPRPQVNPISAIAPGLLRKFFEFRDTSNDRTFAEPQVR